MGSIAQRIAKQILSYQDTNIVDMDSWREGKECAEKMINTNHDPCYAEYVVGQNIASFIAEEICLLKEAKGFVRTVSQAEDDYKPCGPPISPLTLSYFTMWSMFDVLFGSSRETIGSCILCILPKLDLPSGILNTMKLMHLSRMGFYVHCGIEGKAVLLQEIHTGETVKCLVPSGYIGIRGQIWFVRVMEPPLASCLRHVVMGTPYVIRGFPAYEYADYLDREIKRLEQRKPPGMKDSYHHLMKYGLNPNHWNEYIFCAYSNYQHDAVFLHGVPDLPKSMPHGHLKR